MRQGVVFCLLSEFQEPGRFDFQHGGDVEQQVQGDGAADVGGFDGAHVLAADAHPLRQLLLGQPRVLAVVGDVVAQLDELLGVVEIRGMLFRHGAHLWPLL